MLLSSLYNFDTSALRATDSLKLLINPLCFPCFNFQSTQSHKALLTLILRIYRGQTEH